MKNTLFRFVYLIHLLFLTDIPACGVYFTTYELLVRYQKKNNSDGLMNTIFAGGMAGIVNWLIAMPADVLKSRLQIGLFLNSILKKYCFTYF